MIRFTHTPQTGDTVYFYCFNWIDGTRAAAFGYIIDSHLDESGNPIDVRVRFVRFMDGYADMFKEEQVFLITEQNRDRYVTNNWWRFKQYLNLKKGFKLDEEPVV